MAQIRNTDVKRRLGSINAAAQYVGVHPRTIRRRVSDGTITAWRFGPRTLRVDLNEVEAALRPIPTLGSGHD